MTISPNLTCNLVLLGRVRFTIYIIACHRSRDSIFLSMLYFGDLEKLDSHTPHFINSDLFRIFTVNRKFFKKVGKNLRAQLKRISEV